MTDDLAAWLLARLAEDEQDAWRVHDHECPYHPGDGGCTCGWPERLRADCAAKRKVIRWVVTWPWRPPPPSSVDGLLEQLALPYADRPGYREEWRPSIVGERGPEPADLTHLVVLERHHDRDSPDSCT